MSIRPFVCLSISLSLHCPSLRLSGCPPSCLLACIYLPACLPKHRMRSLPAFPVAVAHQYASFFRDQSSTGQKYATEVDTGKTIGEFKEALATLTNIPAAQQRLIYKGRVLKDEQTVDSYGRRREEAARCECKTWSFEYPEDRNKTRRETIRDSVSQVTSGPIESHRQRPEPTDQKTGKSVAC
jgi:hypothetical protein